MVTVIKTHAFVNVITQGPKSLNNSKRSPTNQATNIAYDWVVAFSFEILDLPEGREYFLKSFFLFFAKTYIEKLHIL
jgi:hypothetical protein